MRHFLSALLVLGSSVLGSFALAGPTDGRLDLYWIDVEGGAATLLVTPAGETVLLDSGNPVRRDADRIVKMLAATGQKQIDHLVITHYHGDHFGGATLLANMLPIRNLYDNGQFEGMPDDPGKAYFDLKADAKHVVKPGQELPLKQAAGERGAKLSLRFLGGQQKFIDPPADVADNTTVCAAAREKERDGSDNANSIVMLVGFGPWKFFDAGDLTWNQEHRLVCPKNLVGQVDVYQVTHHGLDSSNNPLVLQTLKPRVAIMNNGVTKGCLPEVFATLKDTASLEGIYQVHKNLRPDGAMSNVADQFIANKEKDCQGHYIKLSVAPDGKSYAVSIPATKHEKTYGTR